MGAEPGVSAPWTPRDRQAETPGLRTARPLEMLSRPPGSFAVRLEDITLASDTKGFERTTNSQVPGLD